MSIGSRHTLSRTPRVGACTTQLSLFLLCKTAARKRKLGVHSLSPQFLSGHCRNLSTRRPIIAATPLTQQSKNQTAPATNQGRTRLIGNQWFLEPFSVRHDAPDDWPVGSIRLLGGDATVCMAGVHATRLRISSASRLKSPAEPTA
jgi:hypothetical protein